MRRAAQQTRVRVNTAFARYPLLARFNRSCRFLANESNTKKERLRDCQDGRSGELAVTQRGNGIVRLR